MLPVRACNKYSSLLEVPIPTDMCFFFFFCFRLYFSCRRRQPYDTRRDVRWGWWRVPSVHYIPARRVSRCPIGRARARATGGGGSGGDDKSAAVVDTAARCSPISPRRHCSFTPVGVPLSSPSLVLLRRRRRRRLPPLEVPCCRSVGQSCFEPHHRCTCALHSLLDLLDHVLLVLYYYRQAHHRRRRRYWLPEVFPPVTVVFIPEFSQR